MNIKVLSHIPGRMRLNIKGLYKNSNLLEAFVSKLNSEHIYTVKPNIYTSNILITYDKKHLKSIEILNLIHQINKDLYSHKKETGFNNDFPPLKTESITRTIESFVFGGVCAGLLLKPIIISMFTPNGLAKSILLLALGYPLIRKYADAIIKNHSLKLGLLGIGVIGLPILMGQTYTALVVLTVLYLSNIVDILLSSYFEKKLYNQSKNLYTSMDYGCEACNKISISTPILTAVNKIESLSLLLALIIMAVTNSPLVLLTIMVLSILNPVKLGVSLPYKAAYYNRLSHNILLYNIDSLLNIEAIDTAVFIISNTQYINPTIIESIRERGVIDIRVITSINSAKLNKLAADLGIEIKYYNPILEDLLKELQIIKDNMKTIAIISNDEKLMEAIVDKSNSYHISIVIKEDFNKKLNNFDIVILGNNIYMLGDSIDFIKYTNEKVLQNQLLSFWSYLIGILFTYSGVLPLYTWLLAIFSKVFVYFNSLMPLKNGYSYS